MVFKTAPGKVYLIWILFLVAQSAGRRSYAQLSETRISVSFEQRSLESCLLQLQQLTKLSFAYEVNGLKGFSISPRKFRDAQLSAILNYLLDGTNFYFEEIHGVIVIGKQTTGSDFPESRTYSGIVEDKLTGTPLAGVTIHKSDDLREGASTDATGRFVIQAQSDTLKLKISYMSYRAADIVLYAGASNVIIKMEVERLDLDSALVISPEDIYPVPLLHKITVQNPRNRFALPKLFGEADLLSLIKTDPGVQATNDGSGNIVARGGAPDQNLVLLDQACLYNPTHLFGLFSSIGLNAVKEVNIYKGAFPARYGGRISSIWDLSIREGDLNKFGANVSAGTLASELTLEGPLVPKKLSFLISGRKSYHDYYTRMFTPGLNTFHFADLVLKLHYVPSGRDHLYLMAYASSELFYIESDTLSAVFPQDPTFSSSVDQWLNLSTKNSAMALKWRHYYTENLRSDLLFTYSGYRLVWENEQHERVLWNGVMMDQMTTGQKVETGLTDLSARFLTRYSFNDHHDVEFGFSFIRHQFRPYSSTYSIAFSDPAAPRFSPLNNEVLENPAGESSVFFEDKFELNSRLSGVVGLHFNQYFSAVSKYSSFQPRLSLSYHLDRRWLANISYTRMQQGIHRLSFSQTSIPLDVWIPSGTFIKPQIADQVTAGMYGRIANGRVNLNVETYYKVTDHVTELLFQPDSSTTGQENDWKGLTTIGTGSAYGVELAAKMEQGRFKSWINYTLSWSNRKFPDINHGIAFPYKFDRRHRIHFIQTCKIGKQLECSALFSFESRPAPTVFIVQTEVRKLYAGELDEIEKATQLLAYHRLDLGINWTMQHTRSITGVLNLSVLNVYNRKNAIYYFNFIGADGKPLQTTILPLTISLSYSLKI